MRDKKLSQVPLAQSEEHQNENPRYADLSPARDWLYISDRKTLAQN